MTLLLRTGFASLLVCATLSGTALAQVARSACLEATSGRLDLIEPLSALAACEAALGEAPGDLDLRNAVGVIFWAQGDRATARIILQDSLASGSANAARLLATLESGTAGLSGIAQAAGEADDAVRPAAENTTGSEPGSQSDVPAAGASATDAPDDPEPAENTAVSDTAGSAAEPSVTAPATDTARTAPTPQAPASAPAAETAPTTGGLPLPGSKPAAPANFASQAEAEKSVKTAARLLDSRDGKVNIARAVEELEDAVLSGDPQAMTDLANVLANPVYKWFDAPRAGDLLLEAWGITTEPDALFARMQGLSKPARRLLQKELIRLGHLNGSADGVLGPQTRKALDMLR